MVQSARRDRKPEELPISAWTFCPTCARNEVYGSRVGGCDAITSEWSGSDAPRQPVAAHRLSPAIMRKERVMRDLDRAHIGQRHRCGGRVHDFGSPITMPPSRTPCPDLRVDRGGLWRNGIALGRDDQSATTSVVATLPPSSSQSSSVSLCGALSLLRRRSTMSDAKSETAAPLPIGTSGGMRRL
jgi:hypothetical protein